MDKHKEDAYNLKHREIYIYEFENQFGAFRLVMSYKNKSSNLEFYEFKDINELYNCLDHLPYAKACIEIRRYGSRLGPLEEIIRRIRK